MNKQADRLQPAQGRAKGHSPDHRAGGSSVGELLTAVVAAFALLGCCGLPVLVAALGAVAAGAVFGGLFLAIVVALGVLPVGRRLLRRGEAGCCLPDHDPPREETESRERPPLSPSRP